jgi:hypothetical protein
MMKLLTRYYISRQEHERQNLRGLSIEALPRSLAKVLAMSILIVEKIRGSG